MTGDHSPDETQPPENSPTKNRLALDDIARNEIAGDAAALRAQKKSAIVLGFTGVGVFLGGALSSYFNPTADSESWKESMLWGGIIGLVSGIYCSTVFYPSNE